MKTIYLHIGFPRTATTTLQVHLFPNHPQINYFGRIPREKPYLSLIDLVCNLNNDDFNYRYKEILKMVSDLTIDENKTNILSSEFIISYSTHYHKGSDNNTVCRSLKRIQNLFKDINIKVNFFCSIKSQATIIPSFYSVTSPDIVSSKSKFGRRSMTFNAQQIIDYIKTRKTENDKIKRFLDGYKYWKLHDEFNKDFNGETKLSFFVYEEFNNKFSEYISDYLRIDKDITYRLINKKRENTQETVLKEHPGINSKFSIIYKKLKKNFLSPNKLIENFDKKIFNLYFLLKDLVIKRRDRIENINFEKDKESFKKQINILKNNSSLIKEYYKEDNLKLLNELKINIKEYGYF